MSYLQNICCTCLKENMSLQRLFDNGIEGYSEDYYTKLIKFIPDLVRFIYYYLYYINK